MTKEDLVECIDFFSRLNIKVTDITTASDNENENRVVEVEYAFEGNTFKTKPLYYKEITQLDDVKDIDRLHQYFGPRVYWLDIEKHKWPKGSGESDLDNLVIDDMIEAEKDTFKIFLLRLANNNQTGFIQRITSDGRPGHYYHNLENNNHWHDLVIFIKEAILKKGKDISKEYFEHLIFNWDKGKRTSLNVGFPYKIVKDLYKNLQSIQSMMDLINIKSLLRYKKQIILQGPPGTGKTRLAKEIASTLTNQFQLNENDLSDLLKEGDRIPSVKGKTEYKIETIEDKKIILSGAEIEDKNITFEKVKYLFSQNDWDQTITNGDNRGAYALAYFIYKKKEESEQVKIIQFHPSYSYEDFVRGIVAKPNPDGKGIIYKAENKTLAAFAQKALENSAKEYVLIIDEINRANLPSVLGELIYALEYRYDPDKPNENVVESMYPLKQKGVPGEGDRTIKLPKNLFIIGTMNTADRSVGHIDYAIRRRFAFVDVLPKIEPVHPLVEGIFREASKLFIRNFDEYLRTEEIKPEGETLSADFRPEDVWIGHSYFICKKKNSNENESDAEAKPILAFKLKYEVLPILKEYIKDGILLDNDRTTSVLKDLTQWS